MKNIRMTSLALAALLGAGMGALAQAAPTVQISAPRRAKEKLFGGGWTMPPARWTYGGPGTTMAQQKRASKKARNVRRNKSRSH